MRFEQLVDLFTSLTRTTTPHGHENLVFKEYASKHNLNKDEFGNYFIKIGESASIFTCHLDTADLKPKTVKHVFFNDAKSKDYCVCTDGKTILGADDKAGVCVLLAMIEAQKPGLYYFFLGEECGALGSRYVVEQNPQIGENYNKVVSFDRRGYNSVITRQIGKECCSPAFAEELSSRLTSLGLPFKPDPTGILTDSAMFIKHVSECTNISVGYFDEHTGRECLNLTFLHELITAVINIDWETLPVEREANPGLTYEELLSIACFADDLIYYNCGMTIEKLLDLNYFQPNKLMTFTANGDVGGTRSFKMKVDGEGLITLKKGRASVVLKDTNALFEALLNKDLTKIIKTR